MSMVVYVGTEVVSRIATCICVLYAMCENWLCVAATCILNNPIIYCMLDISIIGRKKFNLKNIINALSDVRFSSADWYELGVQLELPANQLDTIK